MKKIFYFVTILFIEGCASINADIEMVKPNEIGFNQEFENRIYIAYCEGNEDANAKFVDNECRKEISKFVYEQNYQYFSVLDHNGTSKTSLESSTSNKAVSVDRGYGYGSTTTFVPQTRYYNVTIHSKEYLFVLIKENDIKNWKNYYIVSDYYVPEKSQ